MKKHHLAAVAGCWEISIFHIFRAGVFFLHFRKPRDSSSSVFPLFLFELENVSYPLIYSRLLQACVVRVLSVQSWQSFSGLLPPQSPGNLEESILVVAH